MDGALLCPLHVAVTSMWMGEWPRQAPGHPTESTPSLLFTLAICATAWAHKQGYFVEPIPRLPPIMSTGDVRQLLHLDPAHIHGDTMTPMAIHLGLRSEDMRRHGVPTRLVASEVKQMYTELPPNHVYIGPGHFSHRWQVGPWTKSLPGGSGWHSL